VRVAWLVVVMACSGPSRPRDDEPAPPPARGDAVVAAATIDAAVDAAPGLIDAPPALAVVDAPIKWSNERAELTLAYRRAHSDPTAKDLGIDPHVIVLHYTGGNSAKSTREYFDNTRIEKSRAQLARAGAVNVSSHYLVDRDGTIYKIQPETQFARHCIGLNHIAIGIENVGENEAALTDAQVAANAALVRDLARRFKITHLLGHYEVMAFRDHAYYVELDPKYKNDKPDPGAGFMKRVRSAVADLKLSKL
jgi:N-acetyl-anhydromuramyl-L-alanine amidase AmpD